jgi:hypothetical protein
MQPRQSPYAGYDPGTMGGMYHYGESPTGETQHFNYALAPGAVAPWMADTPTGTGTYNMFGVKTGGDTTGTTTGTTTGGTTPEQWAAYVNAYPDLAAAYEANKSAYGDFNKDGKTDITDFGLGQYTNYGKAEGRSLTGPAGTAGSTASNMTPAQWATYVNNTPDLAAAYAQNNAAYGDFDKDGDVDIADFGLGQYTNYGKKEGRSLTGLAAPISGTTPAQLSAYVNAYPDLAAAYAADKAAYGDFDKDGDIDINDFGLGHYTNYGQKEGRSLTGGTTSGTTPAQLSAYVNAYPDLAKAYEANKSAFGDFDRDGDIDINDFGLGHYTNYGQKEGRSLAGPVARKAGGSVARSQFAVQGPGTGRSDSIPASLSDGEYVMDAETVALLGDGSSKAGAKKLDAMRSNLRKHKGRSLAQGRFSVNAKAPEAYMSGGRT